MTVVLSGRGSTKLDIWLEVGELYLVNKQYSLKCVTHWLLLLSLRSGLPSKTKAGSLVIDFVT